MGQPDGGWYDDTPPRVIAATPTDKAINVKAQKINICTDSFLAEPEDDESDPVPRL